MLDGTRPAVPLSELPEWRRGREIRRRERAGQVVNLAPPSTMSLVFGRLVVLLVQLAATGLAGCVASQRLSVHDPVGTVIATCATAALMYYLWRTAKSPIKGDKGGTRG